MRIIKEKEVLCSGCGLPLIGEDQELCHPCRVSPYTQKARAIGVDVETPHWKDIGSLALGVALIAAFIYYLWF